MNKKILFTGGHHNSAINTIDWLLKNDDNLDFYWMGSGNSVHEIKEVKSRNIPYHTIKAGKLFRFSNYKYIGKAIYQLLLIPFGFIQTFLILAKIKPDLVVSFGGYIAVPVVICSWILRIKSVTHEQTVVLGLANKLISKFVSKIYTSWPVNFYEAPAHITKKMIYTGLPISDSLLKDKSKIEFKRKLPIIYITGGKQGSMFINQLIISNLSRLLDDFNIIWSCGDRVGHADYDEICDLVKKLSKEKQEGLYLKKYFSWDEINMVLRSAASCVTRGGGHTVYELAVLAIPSIIIPIPWSSNNEQLKNAKVLEKLGLSVILEEEKLTSTDFYNEFIEFSGTIEKRRAKYLKNQLDLVITSQGQENLGNEIKKNLS